MRRVVTAREQAEMLAPWKTAASRFDNPAFRRRLDEEWAFNSLTPKQQRKHYEKSIKNDPEAKHEWASRPDKSNPTLETAPESLDQPTLPGMEKIRGESTRLWRGVPLDTTDPAFRKVWQMTFGQGHPVDDPGLFPDADLRYEDRGGNFDHPGLADAILDGFEAKGGVGEHHSTDYDTADDYGWNRGGGSMNYGEWRDGDYLPVLMDSDWNGAGEKHNRAGSGNFDHEHEIMLRHRKAPLTVRQLMVPDGGVSNDDDEWNDILRDSRDITAAYWGF